MRILRHRTLFCAMNPSFLRFRTNHFSAALESAGADQRSILSVNPSIGAFLIRGDLFDPQKPRSSVHSSITSSALVFPSHRRATSPVPVWN
jgi:hypothetical protein